MIGDEVLPGSPRPFALGCEIATWWDATAATSSVLLPRAGAHEALLTAERVRQAVEKAGDRPRRNARPHDRERRRGRFGSFPRGRLKYLDLADGLRRSKGLRGNYAFLLCDAIPDDGITKDSHGIRTS